MASVTTLAYPSSQINRDFLIKVYGQDEDGQRINILVGVSGAIALIGTELFNKFLKRTYNNINADKTVCKLRRGIKFTFYWK